MADCKIVNASVVAAINNIGGANQGALEGIALEYKNAGDTLIEALKNAIATMEGETKDALLKFFEGDVQQFVVTDLPTAINGMSVLLEANRSNFENVDKQIAQSITGG